MEKEEGIGGCKRRTTIRKETEKVGKRKEKKDGEGGRRRRNEKKEGKGGQGRGRREGEGRRIRRR